jgi:hypothetical protein
MPTPTFRAQFAVPVLLVGALFAISFTSLAEGKSKTKTKTTPGALRVVNSAGKSLADGTQFTGPVTIKTSKKADCLGEGTGGSGDKVDVPGSTALGQLAEGGAAFPGIDPLSVTDAFDFGLGLCGIGNSVAPSTGYWYLKVNHAASFSGADQTTVGKGDEILWYLIADFNDPAPDELVLKAPTSADLGEQVSVKVLSYTDDGTKSPAAGVTVSGAPAGITDADGKTTLVPGDGVTRLRVARTGSIPSNTVALCTDKASKCPAGYATTIGGTSMPDEITGTSEAEEFLAGAGDDDVDARAGSGRDKINCGPGKDSLVLSKGSKSKFQSCEKVSYK